MRIGQLRHYINIASKEASSGNPPGDRGEPTTTWESLYVNVPACIETLNGREAEESRKLVATCDHKVTIRYHSGITTKDRVEFNGRIFSIGHIENEDQRNRWLMMLVSEVK